MSKGVRALTGRLWLGALVAAIACLLLLPVTATAVVVPSIEGQVTDSSAEPLNDVDISLLQYAEDEYGGWWDCIDWAYTGDDPMAQGSYAFYGIADGDYVLEFGRAWETSCGPVWKYEYWNGTTDIDAADSVSVVSGSTFTADAMLTEPVASLAGEVTDGNGTAIEDFNVTLYRPDGEGGWYPYGDIWGDGIGTAGNGSYVFFDLPDDDYRIRFECNIDEGEGYTPLVEYWNDKDALADADTIPVVSGSLATANAMLSTGGTTPPSEPSVAGNVTGELGEPLNDVYVTLLEYYDDPDGGWWEWVDATYTGNDPDGEGGYALYDVADGEYRLEFGRDWETPGGLVWKSEYWSGHSTADAADPVIVQTGSTFTANAVLTPPSVAVAGQITDESGSPLNDVEVALLEYVEYDDEWGWWEWVGSTNTSYDPGSLGRYSFTDVPDGEYRIEFAREWDTEFGPVRRSVYWNGASDPDQGDAVTVVAGSTFTADAVLTAPNPSIGGFVTDESGDPVEGIAVGLYADTYDGFEEIAWTYTNGIGGYAFCDLEAGTYRAVASNGWASSSYWRQTYDGIIGGNAELGTDIVFDGTTQIADFSLIALGELGPDAFEPDDIALRARSIAVDGTHQLRTIFPETDVDWIKFPTQAGKVYSLDVSSVDSSGYHGGGEWALFDSNFIEHGDTLAASSDGFAYARVRADSYYSANSFHYAAAITESVPSRIAGTVSASGTGDLLKDVSVDALTWEPVEGWWNWEDWSSTDASGEYALSRLTPGREYIVSFNTWALPAYAGEYFDDVAEREEATGLAPAAGETLVADAELELAASIAGRVTDELTGLPVEGLEVTVYGASHSGYHGWAYTDENGEYSLKGLKPGAEYKAEYRDWTGCYQTEWWENAPDASTATTITPTEGEVFSADVQVAVVADTASIRGQVIDDVTQEPIRGVVVEVLPADPLTFGGSFSGYTDVNGNYRIGGLPSDQGDVVLKFSDPQGAYLAEYYNDQVSTATAEPVPLVNGEFFVADAGLAPDTTKAIIRGQVTDEVSTDPIPNAFVQVYVIESDGSSSYVQGDDTGTDGSYEVRGLTAGREYVVQAHAPWYNVDKDYLSEYYNNAYTFDTAERIVLAEGEARVADIGLIEPVSLSGTVLSDGSGLAATGVEVRLYRDDALLGQSQIDWSTTGSDGKFDFGWLAPGTYFIEFVDGFDRYFGEWYDDAESFETATPIVVGMDGASISASLAMMPVPDVAPPTTEIQGVPAGWTNADVSFTLTADDGDGSGVEATYYTVGGGEAQLYADEPVIVSAGGVTDVTFWSVDLEGNTEDPAKTAQVRIDKTKPTTTSNAAASYTGTAKITLTPNDTGGSGVKETWWKLGSGAWVKGTSCTVSTAGTYTLQFYSTDNAGNTGDTTTKTFTVNSPVVATYLTIKASPTSLKTYDAATVISGTLRAGSATGAGIANQSVYVQTYTSGAWKTVKTLTTNSSGAVSWSTTPRSATKYRLSYPGKANAYLASATAAVKVMPKAYLSAPAASRYGTRAYTISSKMKPRHKAGTYPVRIYRWKYVSGKWKSYGYVKAKAYDYRSYTKVKVKHKFPSKGKWRIKAVHPADSGHLKSKSGYTYLTVK